MTSHTIILRAVLFWVSCSCFVFGVILGFFVCFFFLFCFVFSWKHRNFGIISNRYCPMICNVISLETSSYGNIFRVTGHLCGEFTGQRWIPHTKASDVELLMLSLICTLNKRLNKQSWGWWFDTSSRPLRRHCNEHVFIEAWLHVRQWSGSSLLQVRTDAKPLAKKMWIYHELDL